MPNRVRWPLSYVQGETLKAGAGDTVRLLRRRALLPSEGAQSMTTEKDHPEKPTGDQELIDAELELNRLRAAKRYDDTDDIETKI
jgi:hypothetical protein